MSVIWPDLWFRIEFRNAIISSLNKNKLPDRWCKIFEIQSNYSKVFPRYKLNYFFHTLFCVRSAPPRYRDSSSISAYIVSHPFMQRVYRVDSFNIITLLSLIDSRLMALIWTGNGVEYLCSPRIMFSWIGERRSWVDCSWSLEFFLRLSGFFYLRTIWNNRRVPTFRNATWRFALRF